MNKQEIETAIEIIASDKKAFESVNHGGFTNKIKAFELAISVLEQQLTNGWIPCVERLPGNDNPALATARRKDGARGYFIYKACYVAPKTKTTEDYGWDIDNVNVEYDEGKDCYWIPECWYEDNAVEDNANWILDDDFDVVAWQPLPEPWKEVSELEKVFNRR